MKLERAGLITQDTNQRWYAGPLTSDKLREHFEMRWLLEPAALGQAMDRLNQAFIAARRERLQRAQRHPPKAANRERLELDLHVDRS